MTPHQQVKKLLDFIDHSPSPWHAVENVVDKLNLHGFEALQETDSWQVQPGGKYYVVRDDSSLVALFVGHQPLTKAGFNIVGAHTDSPGLRIKPNPQINKEGVYRLGVEVYGAPILATFSDRDLSLAGRVSYLDEKGDVDRCLINFEEPFLRLPNLAIHMNRGVNENGLKFHKQNELPLIMGGIHNQLDDARFLNLLAQQSACQPEQILSWELNVYDTQKGAFWGIEQEFYCNSQLDNLASCHAGITALLALEENNAATMVCALFDHEEIGSESNKGADGSFLPDVLERVAVSLHISPEQYKQALAHSFMVSVDMAHAYQPNFPSAYDPEHKVQVNKGPVIKINVNQRYTSESVSEAIFKKQCQSAGTPWQQYAHRSEIACGSTIGPMMASRLGIRSLDVGNPMWAMHSARETAGVQDHADLIKVLKEVYRS